MANATGGPGATGEDLGEVDVLGKRYPIVDWQIDAELIAEIDRRTGEDRITGQVQRCRVHYRRPDGTVGLVRVRLKVPAGEPGMMPDVPIPA